MKKKNISSKTGLNLPVGYFSLAGADATGFPPSFYLAVFEGLRAQHSSYIGIVLSDRLSLQIKPVGCKWYVELLDTELLNIRQAIITKTEARKLLKRALTVPPDVAGFESACKNWNAWILSIDDKGGVTV